MQKNQYTIGLMSGTSMDGIDAVCGRFCNNLWQGVVAHIHIPFPPSLRDQLLSLQSPQFNDLHLSQTLALKLTQYYTQATKELLRLPETSGLSISAIGCHGQTIRHSPDLGFTIQLANWAKLAVDTQIPVVGDFRSGDISAGGQGAPLVPLFHQKLFFNQSINRVIINLGGIANISILSPNKSVQGFDTGPANMLMDAWVQKYFQQAYDHNSYLATRGSIIPRLLNTLYSHEYFRQPPPKSTGRDLFDLSFVEKHLTGQENPYDVLRTLLELTAVSVTDAILQHTNTGQALVCGGGAYNPLLLQRISEQLPNWQTQTTDQIGIPAQYIEASAFAWLAYCRIHHIRLNLQPITGSQNNPILGAVWLP